MASHIIGVTREIGRRGEEEVTVDWRIPNFPTLLDGREVWYAPTLLDGTEDWYASNDFIFGDGKWCLMMEPNCGREAGNPASGWVRLDLYRWHGGPPATVSFSVGIRGSGGVEKRREWEKEFKGSFASYRWDHFCSTSYLLEHRTRLMPDGTLIIRCVLKRPGASRGVLSHPSDSAIREPAAPDNRSQSSENRGELTSGVLVTYSYKELQTLTQNFGDLPLRDGGCKIGEGGFGTVYRVVIGDDAVAVKRLKDPVDKQFMTELMTLTNYRHENLLPLIGFSLCPTGGHQCCLLYAYMPNGSLEDRLASADGSEPLSWQTRLSISYGTALGIHHLHTFGEKPMVHRDIKSANILLDQNFVPKVGDFGLVRTGSRGVRSSTQVQTENPSGTLVYMPREAQFGDVSVKWDTFSFGVVLLELVTGLPPLDPDREDRDLVAHMAACEDIRPRLDTRTDWNREAAKELYGIARKRCLVQSRSERSTISEILEDLRILSSAEKKTETKTSFFSRLLKRK